MKDNLRNFLTVLGLSSEEANIYSVLVEKGPSTILQVSRETKINRTKIYRLLDLMLERGIVEEVVDEKRKLLKAADTTKLEYFVKEQESKSKTLTELFPQVRELISNTTSLVQPGTKVLFYRGSEGIKQMVWNTLRSNSECVGFTYRDLDEIVGGEFATKWKEEFVLRGLKFRDIVGNSYLKSIKKGKDDIISDKNFQTRFIENNVLEINHQSDIYNDVVAYYNWFEGEVFGVEIYNAKIAQMQKQIFELIWEKAK